MTQIQPVIHVGLPKTATTSLQRQLFPHHPGVSYLGKYPLGRQSKAEGRYLTHEIGALLSELVEVDGLPRAWMSRVQEHIQPLLDAGQVPVWSLERLCVGALPLRDQRARRIAKVLGPAKVVVVLRDPVALIESLYFQQLKAVQLRDASPSKTGRFFDIGTWLNESWADQDGVARNVLDYGRTLQVFVQHFGRENVGVFLFEDLVTAPAPFLDAFCGFCGIDAAPAHDLIDGERKNVRWSAESVARLRTIARVPFAPLLFRRLSPERRASWLGVHRKRRLAGPRAQAEIPGPWMDRIADATRSANLRIRDEWALPLDRYGYPL